MAVRSVGEASHRHHLHQTSKNCLQYGIDHCIMFLLMISMTKSTTKRNETDRWLKIATHTWGKNPSPHLSMTTTTTTDFV